MDADLLGQLLGTRPPSAAEYRRKVEVTPDFRRIHDLPRRDWETSSATPELVQRLTKLLRAPGGTQQLRPAQATILREAYNARGALVLADVGTGKTIPGLLLGQLLQLMVDPPRSRWNRIVYLVPGEGGGVGKIKDEAREYARHWRVPTITFLSYEKLAGERKDDPRAPGVLDRYAPELLVCDEASRMSNSSTATWKIVSRYVRTHKPVFVAMDATFADSSLGQFWHLIRLALAQSAPVPDNWHEMVAWSGALDVDPQESTDPGALELLAELTEQEKRSPPRRRARLAFRKRLVSTPGVIATGLGDRPTAGLRLSALQTELPAKIQAALAQLRAERVTPNGDKIRYALEMYQQAMSLACGYFTYWDPQPPMWWLEPRRFWREFESTTLAHNRTLLRPMDVARAVDLGQLPDGVDLLADWREVEPQFTPNSVVEWIDDAPLHAAAEWLAKHPERGLIWTSHQPAGQRLSEIAGRPFFASKGVPTDADRFGKKRIDKYESSAIVSLNAIWKGFNLQHYNCNLYVDVPTTARRWQQSLGRTHRSGQTCDVSAEVWLACDEHIQALGYAMRRARYTQDTYGSAQKLLYAANDLPQSVIDCLEQETEPHATEDEEDE